jgi:hypothetical protein
MVLPAKNAVPFSALEAAAGKSSARANTQARIVAGPDLRIRMAGMNFSPWRVAAPILRVPCIVRHERSFYKPAFVPFVIYLGDSCRRIGGLRM